MRLNYVGRRTAIAMVVIAVIALVLASIFPAKAQSQNKDFETCIRQYVAKYAGLCDAADIVARGVAAACAPAPTPLIGSMKDDHGAQVGYDLQKSKHEMAYNKSLVAILDGRVSNLQNCPK